uniref:Uncharacterized protein n=1 Tax=Vitis vinifera TaxID=29760 RepID=A5C8W5_VITVI|nr:hypothetical protein VITISV_010108 [Vitis vinifera]
MVCARFRRHLRRAAKSIRNNKFFSQGCEVGFHLEVLSFQLAAYIGQLQEEIQSTVQKGCEIIPQQKGDFATLCKMLPLAWSDRLAMAVTSSFQLQIAHRLKHWIFDFLSFEMLKVEEISFHAIGVSTIHQLLEEHNTNSKTHDFGLCSGSLLRWHSLLNWSSQLELWALMVLGGQKWSERLSVCDPKVFLQTFLHFASQFRNLKAISTFGGDFAAILKLGGDFAAISKLKSDFTGVSQLQNEENCAAKWHSCAKSGFAAAKHPSKWRLGCEIPVQLCTLAFKRP